MVMDIIVVFHIIVLYCYTASPYSHRDFSHNIWISHYNGITLKWEYGDYSVIIVWLKWWRIKMWCYFLGIVLLLTKQYGALEYDFRNWIRIFLFWGIPIFNSVLSCGPFKLHVLVQYFFWTKPSPYHITSVVTNETPLYPLYIPFYSISPYIEHEHVWVQPWSETGVASFCDRGYGISMDFMRVGSRRNTYLYHFILSIEYLYNVGPPRYKLVYNPI